MPFMEMVFQALARHSSSLPVHLIRGSVGGEFFLFFLPFDVTVGSGASSSSPSLAYSSSSSSTPPRALASSCVKKPGLDAAAMEPDVIMSLIRLKRIYNF
jgi:hypothetical protein